MYELLMEQFHIHAHCIGFPELVVPGVLRVRVGMLCVHFMQMKKNPFQQYIHVPAKDKINAFEPWLYQMHIFSVT